MKIIWKGSKGFTEPKILWPMPNRYDEPGNLKAFGYTGEVVYPLKAQLLSGRSPLHAVAQVSYLTCDGSCVPYKYTFTLNIPKGIQSQTDADLKPLMDKFLALAPSHEPRLEDIPMAHEGNLANPPNPPFSKGGEGEYSLPWMVALAFLGGLILNIMPCVLPVLSIKLFGLLEHSGQDRLVIVRDALASAAGILLSFMGLAGAAVILKKTGQAIGWGVQFQEPLFVATLAAIVTLFALNLWGVFEIDLPPWLAHLGSVGQSHEGVVPFVLSGFFATLLATPCSAPFLGTAMGFALAQQIGVIFTIFLATGAGMAVPYFALAAFPQSLQWMPKPGVWIIHVRVILGFFLAATGVWLGYILSNQVDAVGVAYAYLGLVGVGFVAWLKQVLITSRWREARWARWGVWALLAAVFLGILSIVNKHRLSIEERPSQILLPQRTSVNKEPLAPALSPGERGKGEGGALDWEPFDPGAIARYLAMGRSVFVDVTADWCFTCKVNEKAVLESAEVMKAFNKQKIVVMKADWTNRDAVISDYLKSFSRYGIPFYALYQPGKQPIVLSELLTKRKVLLALQE